ncbi:MAG: type II secretion system F family protein [Bacillota bacterium]|nr:type II secretion system F family protein [Bacillota bacterium]
MEIKYIYKARDIEGKKIKGELYAPDRKSALGKLQAGGLVVTKLTESSIFSLSQKLKRLGLLKRFGFSRYSGRELMLFTRQFSTMLSAGVPILRILHILSGKMEKHSFRKRLITVAAAVEEGSSLSDAMRRELDYFPLLLVNMVEAGETSGKLDEVMDKMADHFEKQHDLEEKIRTATAYPVVITVISIVVVAVMLLFVLPRFAGIFESYGMDMPLVSALFLSLGQIIIGYWPFILTMVLLLPIALIYTANTVKGKSINDNLKFRLPFYGTIYRQIVAARFARTFSTLLSSGTSLHRSLMLVDRVIDNREVSEAIKDLSDALYAGDSIYKPMRTSRVFPPLLVEMIRIGEETGALDQTLDKTADYYEREISYLVGRLSTILEPALLLLVGTFIGMIVYSVLSPMYRVFELI